MAGEIFHLVSIIFLINADRSVAMEYIRACQFDRLSSLRASSAKFTISDIDFSLCTHYIYCCAKIDFERRTVTVASMMDEGLTGEYRMFNDAKKTHPAIKTILSVGGKPRTANEEFEKLNRKDAQYIMFARNSINFVKKHGFDGLNIHWEMEKDELGKTALTRMMQELRSFIDKSTSAPKLLLTMTGFGLPVVVGRRYNVKSLSTYIDYVFVETKDLINLGVASFYGPLYHNPKIPKKINNVNHSLLFWKYSGMPQTKIVMSVTALGRYVRLQNPSMYEPGASCAPVIMRGPTYKLDESLAYPEVCRMLEIARHYYDNVQKNSYLVAGPEWVGYTDITSLGERINFMMHMDIAGIALTNLDEDDFSGSWCRAGKFPLTSFIRNVLDPRPITVRTERPGEAQKLEPPSNSKTTTAQTISVGFDRVTDPHYASGGASPTTAIMMTPIVFGDRHVFCYSLTCMLVALLAVSCFHV